ncbi:hypothetical protein VTL71DRAFT_14763 [Oculimacula yallundae]|uniref:Uncharacterized protein n=1 Tax=Oculimacula yallundae TaxID=86028 RepID=A0ABR4CJF3_9HELO
MANFDSDHWYRISQAGDEGSGLFLSGLRLFCCDNTPTGASFFNKPDTPGNVEWMWQIYPFNSTYYVLRTQASGPLGYLTVYYAADEETTGSTKPRMTNASISDNSMFWKIKPWGDGTFFMENAANGSAWHLWEKPNTLMAMSSNITAPPQDGQRFAFKQSGQIQNASFSTVVNPMATEAASPSGQSSSPPATSSSSATSSSAAISSSTAMSSSSATSSPTASIPPASSSPSSPSGLSTGARAGIGAGVGVGLLIALVILGFFLVKRRKRAQNPTLQNTGTNELGGQQVYEAEAKQARIGELDAHVSPPVAELNAQNWQHPAEMPAWNGR